MWKIFIRPERCIGCHACEIACENNHDGISHVRVYNVPVFCRHCEVPPCVTACYRDAIEIKNGRVLLRKDRCTNCGICVYACPFGAIMLTETNRNHGKIPLVHKCDGCMERETTFLYKTRPACVATCPSGAIGWGEIVEESNYKRLRAYFLYLSK